MQCSLQVETFWGRNGTEVTFYFRVLLKSAISAGLPPVSLERPATLGRSLSNVEDKSSSKFSNFSDDIFFTSFSCDKTKTGKGDNQL